MSHMGHVWIVSNRLELIHTLQNVNFQAVGSSLSAVVWSHNTVEPAAWGPWVKRSEPSGVNAEHRTAMMLFIQCVPRMQGSRHLIGIHRGHSY